MPTRDIVFRCLSEPDAPTSRLSTKNDTKMLSYESLRWEAWRLNEFRVIGYPKFIFDSLHYDSRKWRRKMDHFLNVWSINLFEYRLRSRGSCALRPLRVNRCWWCSACLSCMFFLSISWPTNFVHSTRRWWKKHQVLLLFSIAGVDDI